MEPEGHLKNHRQVIARVPVCHHPFWAPSEVGPRDTSISGANDCETQQFRSVKYSRPHVYQYYPILVANSLQYYSIWSNFKVKLLEVLESCSQAGTASDAVHSQVPWQALSSSRSVWCTYSGYTTHTPDKSLATKTTKLASTSKIETEPELFWNFGSMSFVMWIKSQGHVSTSSTYTHTTLCWVSFVSSWSVEWLQANGPARVSCYLVDRWASWYES